MRLPFLRLFRELSGSGEQRFVDLLARQIDATINGARLAREVVGGRVSDTSLRDQMRLVEHEGDDYRAQVVEALSEALITPIDREDLFRVSRAIDDVLDNLRDFAIEWDLHRMDSTVTFDPLLEAVIEGMSELRSAVTYLVEDPSLVSVGAVQAKKRGNQIRRLFQSAVADLLSVETFDMRILKTRELLRRLDIVGIRLRQASDLLAEALVKRSH